MAEVDRSLVNSFKEVCAVDDDKAIDFLRHCDGNLEEAVQLYFVTGGSLDNSNEGAQNVHNEENELRQRNVAPPQQQPRPQGLPGGRVQPPRGNQPIGWMQWIVTVLSLPFQFVYSSMWDILGFLGQFLLGRSPAAVTDPLGDVAAFLDTYHSTLLPPSQQPLDFVPTGFSEAARLAKNSLRPLFVYLHSNSQECVNFAKMSLHCPEFREVVQRNNVLLWAAGVDRPEGRSVAFSLRVRAYPFVGLMVPVGGRLSLNLRVDRLIGGVDLATNMQFSLEEHTAQMNVQRLERAQREADAELRREQNLEYEESARKDRERAEQKRLEEQRKRESELAVERAQKQKENRLQRISEYRQSVKGLQCAGAVRVQVRFPTGEKTVLQLAPDEPVTRLFDAIIANEACPNYFSVSNTFPKKVLNVAPLWYVELCHENEADNGSPLGVDGAANGTTVEEAGVQNGTALMVQDLNA